MVEERLVILCEHSNGSSVVRVRVADGEAPERSSLVDRNLRELSRVVRETIRCLHAHNADARVEVLLRQRCFDKHDALVRFPFTEHLRGVDGTFTVNLCVRGEYLWCQNVFQLAHEFCHVLCAPGTRMTLRYQHVNQWFEEAICHAAAIYALRTFDKSMCARAYNGDETVFAKYAADELGESLPRDRSLAQWYASNRAALRDWRACHAQPQRALQSVVARWLLETVEFARVLECVRYLNDEGRAVSLPAPQQHVSLRRYLVRVVCVFAGCTFLNISQYRWLCSSRASPECRRTVHVCL
jgi:hypothetical protein